uniref:CENP-V/GFA domain-containing protein n=1 Tax=Romanomermis culicivorax TaxID=13658 RepID=A0A915J5V2_ROMCU
MKSFCSTCNIELFDPDPAERDFKNYQVFGHRFTRVNTRTPAARRKLTLANFYVCCDWLERLFPRRLSRLRSAPFDAPNTATGVLPDAVDENVAFSPLGWFFPLSVLAVSGAGEKTDKTLR